MQQFVEMRQQLTTTEKEWEQNGNERKKEKNNDPRACVTFHESTAFHSITCNKTTNNNTTLN